MTFPIFPTSIPRPLASGYTISTPDNCESFECDDGHTSRRMVSRGKPTAISMQWLMNQAKFDQFKIFFDFFIDGGVSKFTMPLHSIAANGKSEFVDRTCFFHGKYFVDYKQDIQRYSVKAKVLVLP